MADVSTPRIARRGFLKLPAAVAASAALIGIAAPPDVLAELATPQTDSDYLAVFSKLSARLTDISVQISALEQEIKDQVNAEVWTLISRYGDLINDLNYLEHRWEWHQVARHAPGIAPMLQLLHDHVANTLISEEWACCRPS